MNTINPIAQAAQEIAGYQQAMRQTGSGTASVQATQLARWRAALEQAIQPQAEALTDEQRLGWYAWRVKDLEEKLANAQKQPPTEAVPADFRDRLVAISQAIADQDDRAAQAMIREILAAPQQAEAVPFFADYFKRIYEFLSSVAPSGIADEAFRNIPEAIFAASERNRISENVEQVRAESKPLSGIDGSSFESKKGDGYVMSAAPQQAEAVPPDPRPVIEMCAKALAEELAAWDIEPPLHHVKEASDACEAWLAAASVAQRQAEAVPPGLEVWLRTVCFQRPTPEAYDLAKAAWCAAIAQQKGPQP